MSNQTHADRVTDAEKKRRAYLREVNSANAKATGGCLLLAICVLLTLCGALGLLCALGFFLSETVADGAISGIATVLFVAGVPTALGLLGTRLICKKMSSIPRIPYVPPVEEQIAALPAAVLLRGSDEPTATPGELLRAAREATATDTDELLRAESNTM